MSARPDQTSRVTIVRVPEAWKELKRKKVVGKPIFSSALHTVLPAVDVLCLREDDLNEDDSPPSSPVGSSSSSQEAGKEQWRPTTPDGREGGANPKKWARKKAPAAARSLRRRVTPVVLASIARRALAAASSGTDVSGSMPDWARHKIDPSTGTGEVLPMEIDACDVAYCPRSGDSAREAEGTWGDDDAAFAWHRARRWPMSRADLVRMACGDTNPGFADYSDSEEEEGGDSEDVETPSPRPQAAPEHIARSAEEVQWDAFRLRIYLREPVSSVSGGSPVLRAQYQPDAPLPDGFVHRHEGDESHSQALVDLWQVLNHQVDKLIEEEYEALLELEYKVVLLKNKRESRGLKVQRISTGHPYRDARVRLDSLPEVLGGKERDPTYIDASFCWGGRYIGTSMPQDDLAREDFWRMVLDHEIKVIVMLNDERERLAQPYWPNKITLPKLHASVTPQAKSTSTPVRLADRTRSSTESALRVRPALTPATTVEPEDVSAIPNLPSRGKPLFRTESKASLWFSTARLIAVQRTLTEIGLDEDDIQEVLTTVRQRMPHKMEAKMIVVEKLEQLHQRPVMIRRLRIRSNLDGRQHTVTHLQYTQWPDQGLPNPVNFANFVQQVRDIYREECVGVKIARFAKPDVRTRKEAEADAKLHPHALSPLEAASAELPKPMLVHCFGGHGRTGTLLSILASLDMFRRRCEIDVVRVVSLLRFDRATQIENESQYKFVYEFVLNYLRTQHSHHEKHHSDSR